MNDPNHEQLNVYLYISIFAMFIFIIIIQSCIKLTLPYFLYS
jgi:hypothetical protein